jgi:hypothetical protein
MKIFNKDLIQNGAKEAFNFVKKNSPHILTGTAVVGVGLTSFFAVKGVIRAKDIIEEEKWQRKMKLVDDCRQSNLYPENDNEPPEELLLKAETLTKKEMIKMIWKPLLPMAITGATTIACVIGSDMINTGRNAALLAVATASEKALEGYQKKNIELFGEKNHDKILNEKAKDKVKSNDIPDEELVLKTGTGEMLILDDWCGRYFRSSRDTIDKAINALNYDMYSGSSAFNDGFISLNDFYDAIGIYEKCQNGDYLGWDRKHPITVDYRSALKDDSIPVLVLSFQNMPLPDYARRY